jgi:hypothetical protein
VAWEGRHRNGPTLVGVASGRHLKVGLGLSGRGGFKFFYLLVDVFVMFLTSSLVIETKSAAAKAFVSGTSFR